MYFPSEAPFALSPGNHGKRSSQAPIMLAITLKVRVQARLTPGMFRKTSRWLAVGAGGLQPGSSPQLQCCRLARARNHVHNISSSHFTKLSTLGSEKPRSMQSRTVDLAPTRLLP